MQVRSCFSDDNRNERGAVRGTAGTRIPVSGTDAAQQRSDAWTYAQNIESSKDACLHAGPVML